MVKSLASCVAILTVWMISACGSAPGMTGGGGAAKVSIADRTFDVSNVEISFEAGEGGYFRIDGDDAANPGKDCVPGLSGGLALYGDIPATVTSLADLSGKELPFEFSGDGDDANLCFVGTNGLLGVNTGTVNFAAVDGGKVTFAFHGTFTVYDGEGGESPAPVTASGSGTAYVEQ
jgi:hypothetical protein